MLPPFGFQILAVRVLRPVLSQKLPGPDLREAENVQARRTRGLQTETHSLQGLASPGSAVHADMAAEAR